MCMCMIYTTIYFYSVYFSFDDFIAKGVMMILLYIILVGKNAHLVLQTGSV